MCNVSIPVKEENSHFLQKYILKEERTSLSKLLDDIRGTWKQIIELEI